MSSLPPEQPLASREVSGEQTSPVSGSTPLSGASQRDALLIVMDRIHNNAEIIDHLSVIVPLKVMAEARNLQLIIEDQVSGSIPAAVTDQSSYELGVIAGREQAAKIAEQQEENAIYGDWDGPSTARTIAAAIRSGK